MASAFAKEDAVFMPSGVMAQNIALLIHGGKRETLDDYSLLKKRNRPKMFACHHSSHLLLHEEEAYKELLAMDAVIVSTRHKVAQNGVSIPPMGLSDVNDAFQIASNGVSGDTTLKTNGLVALILELPHRELGGKLTPWAEVVEIGNRCRREGVKYHCDGARIFESSAAYGYVLV